MYRSRKRKRVPVVHVNCKSSCTDKLDKPQSTQHGETSTLQFTDISTVLYDTLLDILCAAINGSDMCAKVSRSELHFTDHMTRDSRWVAVWAIMHIPLLNNECAAMRSQRTVLHSALIGYERTLAFHYPERVPSWMLAKGHTYDTRWFFGAWPRSITLTHGATSLPNSHPISRLNSDGSAASMWTMQRVKRHTRHVIGALEGRVVPDSYTHAKWFKRLHDTDVCCADLLMLPRKVQAFVANARCLFTAAYTAHPLSRVDMFGKCHLKTCGRVYYRGVIDDAYGKGIYDNGALVDILNDICDNGECEYWRLCGLAEDVYPTQLRRFCCFSCFAEWRACVRALLPWITKECMRAAPVQETSRRIDKRDNITLSLSQGLRRNARIARAMREVASVPTHLAVRRRDRDDVLVQLKQVLNIDIAMLLISAELCDSARRQPHDLPGDTHNWRKRPWHTATHALCDQYKITEPDVVLTSLMTRPTFFEEALRMVHVMFSTAKAPKIRIRTIM